MTSGVRRGLVHSPKKVASCEVVLFHVSLHPNQLEAAALCVYAAAPFITNDVIINDCCTDENDELLVVSVSCGNDRTELLFEKRSKLSTAHINNVFALLFFSLVPG